MNKKIFFAAILFIISISSVFASDEYPSPGLQWSSLRGLEYRLRAGINVGGTSPLPLPEEIRAINSYDPTLQISIEADVVKWLNKPWGLMTWLRLDNKGMKNDARVNNYGMASVSTAR